MSRHRDFDAARAEIEGPPLTFTLCGEEFRCRAKIPAGPILKLASQHDLQGLEAIDALGQFLYSIVVPDQADTLRKVIDEDVTVPLAVEIVAWVIEESTGRPLPMLSDLPLPASEDGPSSNLVSLSPAESRSA